MLEARVSELRREIEGKEAALLRAREVESELSTQLRSEAEAVRVLTKAECWREVERVEAEAVRALAAKEAERMAGETRVREEAEEEMQRAQVEAAGEVALREKKIERLRAENASLRARVEESLSSRRGSDGTVAGCAAQPVEGDSTARLSGHSSSRDSRCSVGLDGRRLLSSLLADCSTLFEWTASAIPSA